jgi:uridine kinase
MKGDILLVNDHHRRAAREVYELLKKDVNVEGKRFVVAIAGESGAGKSEIATALRDELKAGGIPCCILQQDDYFRLPPKSNAARRREDIGWVGPQEVRLDLLDSNLKQFLSGKKTFLKPLVDFSNNRIMEEQFHAGDSRVLIAEGTYTSLLNNALVRVFIERDLDDTRGDREKRAREAQDEFLEKVLGIEHGIISSHRKLASMVITRDFHARKTGRHES